MELFLLNDTNEASSILIASSLCAKIIHFWEIEKEIYYFLIIFTIIPYKLVVESK